MAEKSKYPETRPERAPLPARVARDEAEGRARRLTAGKSPAGTGARRWGPQSRTRPTGKK